jgi:hypothetical protein
MRADEVAAQTGLPGALLDALEAGTVDRLPDRVQTIKALRGYADALGLPGDSYALVMIDLWPAYGGVSPAVVAVQGTPDSPAPTGAAMAPVTRVSRATDSLGETGVVPVAAPSPAVPGNGRPAIRRIGSDEPETVSLPEPDGTAQVPAILADTGVNPAVQPAVYRRRSPLLLRIVVTVVALALVAGIAGLVIHQVRPQWLSDMGLTSSTPGSHPAQAAQQHHHGPPAFRADAPPGATSATFDIHEQAFLVKVVAVGGDAWVTATDPQHASALFAATIPAGQEKDFLVSRAITINTASTAARVFVNAGSKLIGYYFPQAAPYTMTFRKV